MPCYSPMQAYKSMEKVPETGKFRVVFRLQLSCLDSFESISLPCGQCVGCRLERSRQWAVRCIHEASLHESNIFITLTYSPDNVPIDNSLNVRDFQLFMKRLRRRFPDNGIRYFHCGEYGETYGRPHYHAIIFGLDFSDKIHFKDSNGIPVFISPTLTEIWGLGFASIGTVTFDSAAYVARYIMKKVTGDLAFDHYIDPDTGILRAPEYTTMSRNPGIAADWFAKYRTDVFPKDEVVVKGRKMRPPKFYDSRYEVEFPDDFAIVKEKRSIRALSFAGDNTPERLKVREKVQLLKLSSLVRNLESSS